MSNELVAIKISSLGELEKMADRFVKSKLFGAETIDQAFSLMMVAHARGIHPAKAAMDYHIIQGKPALKADAMLGYFQESGGIVQWTVYTDTCVTGLFSHPRAGQLEPIEITWTIEMASKIMTWEKGKQIPLSQKQVWKEYPRAMLRSRCISEGIRTVYPGIISGFYTEEEVKTLADNKRFENAKPVTASAEVIEMAPISVTIESEQPEHQEIDIQKQIIFEFKQKAADLRDEYKRSDADEACNGDEWIAIHDRIVKDWLALCEEYSKTHEWFEVPQEWKAGMNKMLGIEQ